MYRTLHRNLLSTPQKELSVSPKDSVDRGPMVSNAEAPHAQMWFHGMLQEARSRGIPLRVGGKCVAAPHDWKVRALFFFRSPRDDLRYRYLSKSWTSPVLVDHST